MKCYNISIGKILKIEEKKEKKKTWKLSELKVESPGHHVEIKVHGDPCLESSGDSLCLWRLSPVDKCQVCSSADLPLFHAHSSNTAGV
jgi:activator of HSP90 ATPase